MLTTFNIIDRAKASRGCKRSSPVQIACIPSTKQVPDGEACWVAGWGKRRAYSTGLPDALQEAGVNILGRDYCRKRVRTDILRYGRYKLLQQGEICAGIPDLDGNGLLDGGVDTCQGICLEIRELLMLFVRNMIF